MADTQTSQPSVLDTVGGWVNSLGNIFTAGTNAYVAAQQRLDALKSIEEDAGTSTPTTPAAPQVVAGAAPSLTGWVMPAVAVALVLVGIFVARKMR